MKLITFYRNKKLIGGAAVSNGQYAIDFERAAKALGGGAVPGSIREILEGGAPVMGKVRRVVRRAEAKLKRVQEKKERRPAWAQPLGDVELAAPIPNPEKVICIGQNYADHCKEQGVAPPESPILFAKFPTTLCGPAAPIRLPPASVTSLVDYEVELAFVIGTEASNVSKKDAMSHVAGYMVMNDVTARDLQRSEGQWVRAKSIDSFGPCGPWILTADELEKPGDLQIWLELNGEIMQDSSTKNLIFDVPYLVHYLSKTITLRPGDVVATGTPPGVGIARKPPVVLKPGDVVHAGIETIGSIQNRCVRKRR